MAAADALGVTLRVIRVLERLKVDYLVGGSLASSLHGIPRSTQDADLVVDLDADKVPALVEALRDDFYIDLEHATDAVESRSSFNVIHLETMFKVDLFIAKSDPIARVEMERRQRFQLSDESVIEVASAEDTVLRKLLWFELGQGVSERQWRDALGVLKVQKGKLDLEYLTAHAAELGIDAHLQRALKEARS